MGNGLHFQCFIDARFIKKKLRHINICNISKIQIQRIKFIVSIQIQHVQHHSKKTRGVERTNTFSILIK